MRKEESLPIIFLVAVLLSMLLAACDGETPEEAPSPTPTSTPTAAPTSTPTATPTSTPASTPTSPPSVEATATEEAVPETTQTPPSEGPMAVIVSGDSAGLGKPFSFDATQSQAGAAPIVTYQWDMGDGTTVFGQAIKHAYAAPGPYTVRLTVTDGGGQTDSATKAVEVIDEAITPTAESAPALAGTSWVMDNAVRGTTVTLAFDEGSLAGSSGCNSYNANYTASAIDDATFSISVDPIGATGESCTPEVMAQEKGYLESLASASRVTVDGTTLILETGSGTLTFSQTESTE